MCDRNVLIKSDCSERQTVQALKLTEADRNLLLKSVVRLQWALLHVSETRVRLLRTVIITLPAMIRAFLSSAQQQINEDFFLLVKLEKKHLLSYMQYL